jgi:hypothetical protein
MACEVTSYERANEDVFIVNLTAYNGWCEDDINSIDPNRFQMLETTCSFLMLIIVNWLFILNIFIDI